MSSDGQVKPEDLRVGQRVSVALHDCCGDVEFTAAVSDMVYDAEDPTYLESLRFDNGVTIRTLWGFSYTTGA